MPLKRKKLKEPPQIAQVARYRDLKRAIQNCSQNVIESSQNHGKTKRFKS